MYKLHNTKPKGYAKIFNEAFQTYGNQVAYLDIDDMMYTGSQTILNLHKSLSQLKFKNLKLNKYLNYIITREYLIMHELKYYILRPYITSSALELIEKYKNQYLPSSILYIREVLSLKEIITKDKTVENIYNYYLIKIFFNLDINSASSVYFNYKIADISSTCAFSLISGYVPSSDFIKMFCEKLKTSDIGIYNLYHDTNGDNSKILDIRNLLIDLYKFNTKGSCKFINFVKNCNISPFFKENFDEIKFQTKFGVLKNTSEEEEESDVNIYNICPKPIYKNGFGKKLKKLKKKIRRKSKSNQNQIY